MKLIILMLLFFSQFCFAQSNFAVSSDCQKCLTNKEYNQIIKQLEDLLQSNAELIKKAKQLETLQKATPKLELKPISIIVDKQGRVFVNDKVIGKLQIGELSYDVILKLKTQIVTAKSKQYGFGLRFKAVAVFSYELNDKEQLKTYTSPALGLEPFYYQDFNLNLLIGPRIYGPAIGIDITEHFATLIGIGFKYNNEKAFFLGTAFDF